MKPKTLSPSDPAARFTGANGDRVFFAYSTNYLVDLDNAIIVDVEATAPIRQAEVGVVQDMIVRTRDRFNLHPDKLVADTAYGSAKMLSWLVEEEGIDPYIPVIDKSQRKDGTFSREDFVYDPESDAYTCPGGKRLVQFRRTYKKPRSSIDQEDLMRYRASKKDCNICLLKSRCCPKEPARKILRSIHEGDLYRHLLQGCPCKLYTTKTPITAADLLNDKVLPFHEDHDLPVLRILTDTTGNTGNCQIRSELLHLNC